MFLLENKHIATLMKFYAKTPENCNCNPLNDSNTVFPVCHDFETHDISLISQLQWPPAVESSVAVEDAAENRGLYRISVPHLCML